MQTLGVPAEGTGALGGVCLCHTQKRFCLRQKRALSKAAQWWPVLPWFPQVSPPLPLVHHLLQLICLCFLLCSHLIKKKMMLKDEIFFPTIENIAVFE